MSERDELDRERYLVDMHLLFEKRKDKLIIQASRLATLAKFYKKAGHLKDAICEMKRALIITENKDHRSVLTKWEKKLGVPERKCPYSCGYTFPQEPLDLCPQCNRLITACSECGIPNRLFDTYCRWCGIKVSKPSNAKIKMRDFSLSWFYPIPFEYLLPLPVMVGDLVIVPIVNERILLALKISNGEVVRKLENVLISNQNTKLIFCYPYLYAFSTKRIERIMLELEAVNPEIIYNDPNSLTSYPSFPLIDEKTHTILFSMNNGLFSHNFFRRRGALIQMDTKRDDNLFPIMTKAEVFVSSKKGKIYKFYSNKMNLYHSIPNCEIVSPPVSPTGSDWIYFESYYEGKRIINAWMLGTKTILSKLLPDTLCSSDDIHFHNPPLLYKDGVILISCQESKLYYTRSIEGDIDLREIDINISAGIKKVLNIEYLFSLVIGPYLISRISDGFFYFNLEDKNDNGIEFFGSEMMSQPLIFNNRLVLLCKDGVRCFSS